MISSYSSESMLHDSYNLSSWQAAQPTAATPVYGQWGITIME